ncbi:MAG: hydroxyglutarate oxidase [Candidatus Eisenbacteria bacterium RBG_16_71_46]|nr:MAG: hydroxyglutarate oxidase [Candidatus Eisenbacteria bacterium RBG_16_71_46]
MATAMALVERTRVSIVVLEAEDRLAAHQTGHNSGVIHSGLYYAPGSLKARQCVEGREALYRFCAEHGVAHERCGKLVVATSASELPLLDELERRGRANGLRGLRRLGPEEIREREPHASGLAALLVSDAGIVDYARVTAAFAVRVRAAGGTIVTGARATACRAADGGLVIATSRGDVRCAALVNCGGLHSDRIARGCGVDPGIRIIPFRGEYHALVPARRHLVRGLIYPVPDPRFPFLGVHLTRTLGGEVEAGPNAVLALKREGYGRASFSLRDAVELVTYGGFWRVAARYWRVALAESWRSLDAGTLAAALQRLVPGICRSDLVRAGTGVRAQALAPDGRLVDDFVILESERMIHVLNAPSPAATASIAIGRRIADRAAERLGLARRERG